MLRRRLWGKGCLEGDWGERDAEKGTVGKGMLRRRLWGRGCRKRDSGGKEGGMGRGCGDKRCGEGTVTKRMLVSLFCFVFVFCFLFVCLFVCLTLVLRVATLIFILYYLSDKTAFQTKLKTVSFRMC